MGTPSLHILVSADGVEEVEVLYQPSQRFDAWQLCLEYLPLLLLKPSPNKPVEAVNNPIRSSIPT